MLIKSKANTGDRFLKVQLLELLRSFVREQMEEERLSDCYWTRETGGFCSDFSLISSFTRCQNITTKLTKINSNKNLPSKLWRDLGRH